MCGIVARISATDRLRKETLLHRGPDEISTFNFNSLQVEFSRLSITGGSSGSSPVISESGRWVCFLNGEVYNFNALRKSYDLPFSSSDTKIIIEGIAKFGIVFLKQLRGMFAGLILDRSSNMVFIFRDALGEKPLFINLENGVVTISSEFKSIMKILDRPIALNSAALSSYFRFGYAEEPETFDLHVNSIPRGSVYSIDLSSSFFKKEFSLEGYNSNETERTLPELLHIIYEETLQTEVPSALALSGGIDSSSLLVAKAKRDHTEFNPIILDLPNSPNLSEAISAKSACSVLGFDPIIAYVNNKNILNDLQVLANANDQPHADPSGLSYLKIFEAANMHGKKIVFLGHGPDEFFWGYPWLYKTFQKRMLPIHIRRPSRLNYRGPYFWNTPGMSQKLVNTLEVSSTPTRNFDSADIYLASEDPWRKATAYAAHNYLSQNGLRQSDRLAMHFSIEPRTPYADSRLYGWAQAHCTHNPNTSFDKKLFRESLDLGGLEYLREKEKIGFRSEFDTWFQSNDMSEFYENAVKKVEQMNLPWKKNISSLELNSAERYRVLMLGLWL
jgi:asparagine synthase (glutamine-hydrolysing)